MRTARKRSINGFSALVPHHPIVERALANLDAGQPLDPIVHDAKDGAAEVLYGLGGAGSRSRATNFRRSFIFACRCTCGRPTTWPL